MIPSIVFNRQSLKEIDGSRTTLWFVPLLPVRLFSPSSCTHANVKDKATAMPAELISPLKLFLYLIVHTFQQAKGKQKYDEICRCKSVLSRLCNWGIGPFSFRLVGLFFFAGNLGRLEYSTPIWFWFTWGGLHFFFIANTKPSWVSTISGSNVLIELKSPESS